MKTDKQIWIEIGRSIRAANNLRKANQRERDHTQRVKEEGAEVSPSIATKLRQLLEDAKNGKASE